MKLNTIPVLFDQDNHTYTNTETGEMYRGITSTLIHRLFPDKYSGIPQNILERAARKGSVVHEDIELHETVGTDPATEEGRNYVRLKEENQLRFLESEYTVSDLKHYATNIDAIYKVDETQVDLADFKTTSKLDKESLSWQLSICACFFEQNNPHISVRKLYGIWLRGEIAELVEVKRHTAEEVQTLIRADLNDLPFGYTPQLPDYIRDYEMLLTLLARRIKALTDEYDSVKAQVLEQMLKHKDKSFDTGNLLITVMKPSTRESFDSKKFKEEHSDLYNQYIKTSQTKESLKLTLR
jgi:hypothetical protein